MKKDLRGHENFVICNSRQLGVILLAPQRPQYWVQPWLLSLMSSIFGVHHREQDTDKDPWNAYKWVGDEMTGDRSRETLKFWQLQYVLQSSVHTTRLMVVLKFLHYSQMHYGHKPFGWSVCLSMSKAAALDRQRVVTKGHRSEDVYVLMFFLGLVQLLINQLFTLN